MSLESKSYLIALKHFERSINGLGFNDVPPNLYTTDHIDLSQWTLIVTDYSIKQILLEKQTASSAKRYDREFDSRHPTDPTASKDVPLQNVGIQLLDLTGGERITNRGLKYISEACKSLHTISLENAYQLTEIGLQYLCRSCVHINELNLSGCMGISGLGFSVIGKHLRNLRVLKLSGCNIHPSSFVLICEGCTSLEKIDVSHCQTISDQDLQVLSEYCHAVKEINLKECQQVSDVGVLSLSQGCTHIETIDLKRSQLLFKVTDVALLSLSERCNNIQSISLNGCEMITDTGLSWLCQGCTQLKFLDLTNCTKVTNTGMNSISTGCHKLRQIILVRLKRVTDTGIRFLSQGCELLEHINAAGVFRLSNGKKSNEGNEGLQALGKSKCAENIKYLNLHGCFQISTIVLRSIALLTNLESLILSGCVNLTNKGLSIVALSCPKVTLISFASCGDCINDITVQIITKHMINLSRVNISGCGKIGRRAMDALSKCKDLKWLDLSGCKGLTDLAILPLCEGVFSPGLHALYLTSCNKITDTGLAWIANGFKEENGDLTLHTLSLKGTKITTHALISVRDRFCLSDLKNNESFLGFYPAPRATDRKIIASHAREYRAATKLQAKFRSCKATKETNILKQAFCREKVALQLQSRWRGYTERCFLTAMKQRKELELKTAIKIQSFFRCKLAIKERKRLEYERWMLNAFMATCKIQKRLRGNKGRQLANIRRHERNLLLELRKESSIRIQSMLRMATAIRERNRLHQIKVDLDHLLFISTRTIQLMWRVAASKTERNQLQKQLNELQRKRDLAARAISKCYRQHVFRLLLEAKVQDTKIKNINAISIQCFWRQRVAFDQLMKLKFFFNAIRERKAAITIQQGLRRMEAIITINKKRLQAQKSKILKGQKAIIINRWWRMCAATKRAEKIRVMNRKYEKENFELEMRASTMIAATWRGKKGRDVAREVVRARKERWKQMWSDEDKRYFYYNQITGESRWRKPQALLDLDPRPLCSNCVFYEAKIECANCVEYYCYQCWDAVHFGGKRSYHDFRALYDFYDKRIDYGDDEFPSRWPTEIQQDEFNGWQLRVRPLRNPSYVQENWEVYVDPISQRLFYYNNQTGQSTYIVPDVVRI